MVVHEKSHGKAVRIAKRWRLVEDNVGRPPNKRSPNRDMGKSQGPCHDQAYIEQGLAMEETKDGNDWADHYATKGIEQHQQGATQLAKWLASRQKDYAKFMGKVQKIIVAVLKKEKEERGHKEEIQKTLLGYDPQKQAKVTCRLPPQQPGDDDTNTFQLELIPPVTSTHAYANQQKLYRCIHKFLNQGRWYKPDENRNTSGTTWLELFIQFDTLGWREQGADYTRNPDESKRAKARNAKMKKLNPTYSRGTARAEPHMKEGVSIKRKRCQQEEDEETDHR